MQLVERHVILDDRFYDICHKSGLLYNFVTYHYRQSIFGKQEYFSEYEMSNLCAEYNQQDYRALPAQTSQQIIKQVFKNFKSWIVAKKDYEKNPSKYLGKPRLPKYKSGNKQNIVVFTNQNAKLKNGFIHFPKSCNLKPFKTNVLSFQQVRIIPNATCYIVEIVYEKQEENLGLNEYNFISLDLGLNNYVSAISNVEDSFIINGKIIKSFNHWFNKRKAKLMSFVGDKGTSNRLSKLNNKRNFWIEDKTHKISRYLINYCIKNNIGTIIIGKNKQWKNSINIGKKNNQKFVEVPHAKLIEKITYKALLVGIKVIETEESYTSKCDALALEAIKKQESYLGKRVKRGLFKSSIGKTINADINGACNIARKVIGDSFIKEIVNSGLVFRPKVINIF
jgi:putative transposase